MTEQKHTRFTLATRFTGMLIAQFAGIALILAGVIGEEVLQYLVLGSYLIYAGADVGEIGLEKLRK